MGAVELLLGVGFAACLAVGLTMGAGSTQWEFAVSKAAFVAAAVMLVAAYLAWLAKDRQKPFSSTARQVVLGLAAFFIIALGTPESFHWVNMRARDVEEAAKPLSAEKVAWAEAGGESIFYLLPDPTYRNNDQVGISIVASG
ncbi:MAG TPA: hypothetical protein VMQ11_14185, partial [Alphaproteobacteria bacterium]|nr:hypothetical protein [Alphaproteobacteria bacterium]